MEGSVDAFHYLISFSKLTNPKRTVFFVQCLKRCRGSPSNWPAGWYATWLRHPSSLEKGCKFPHQSERLSHRCWLEPDVIKTQVCCRIIWSGTACQLYSLPLTKKVINRFFMAGGKGEWLTEINNNNNKNSCYMTLLKCTLMICSCTPSSVCVPWKQLQIVSTNRSISLLPGILLSRALPVIWPYAMSFYKWQILPKSKKHSNNIRCLISCTWIWAMYYWTCVT